MASTSTTVGQPERVSTNTSQGTAPSPSTSEIALSPSLCSSCFDWVSSFIPWRSFQSNSMASISTPDRIPENEVMGAIEKTTPSASTSTKREAFKDIAPPPPASASTLNLKPCYDVFINHCGQDVKQTLATSIYDVLNNMKVKAFLDKEELECGDFFPTTLEAVMRRASLHIAIFSKNYAKSPWCLDELSFMLETGVKIFPVFYHVDPADLRHVDRRNGMYAKAFEEHGRKGRHSSEKLQKWKKALHVVSFYTGEIIKNDGDEMRLLKNIVSCVLKEIKNVPLMVAKHPVGLKEIVEDFKLNTLRSAHGDQVVQIVGIWGMGGAGKTTLVTELYNKISSSMERSSFVFNVREAATKGLLHDKQKKLLNDLGVQHEAFDNIQKGMGILSRGLRSVRVLIVLDDVDNVEQLNALLPTKDSLEKGSLIIVTTRAYDVLRSWGISSTYKMRPLDRLHAEELFCWHAFLNPRPRDGFMELVEKFLEACNGLPLSLKVFGAQLYGEFRKEYWESQLHKISKISRILPDDIKQILKISYEALDEEEKEMFLDSACFFIGKESSTVIEIWNGMGWSGLCGWEKLLNRCLVEIDHNNNLIRMHDHLRDLGRDIANKKSPYRLWFPGQIIDVEKQQKKRVRIQGIIGRTTHYNMRYIMADLKCHPLQYLMERDEVDDSPVRCSRGELMVETNCGTWSLAPSSVGIKYLEMSGDYYNEVMGEVSRELVWLHWKHIGQRNLSSGLLLKKLSVLELYWSGHLEELWGETDAEVPVQLRGLLISYCHKLQRFPNSIGRLCHLKKIKVTGGCNITSLPDEFCLLQSLEHLVLPYTKLSALPSNFGNLRNLRHLNLSYCLELRSLPVSFKKLMLLEHLNLEECSQLTFTSEDLNFLENITKLEFLNLSKCKQLEELPRHISNQASLRELYFDHTSLRELPDNIGQLSRLREMKIEDVLLSSLPTSLRDLSSLTSLSIRDCPMLGCLPKSLAKLSSLTNLSISRCPQLECLPDSLLGDLPSLTKLSIHNCPGLECLPEVRIEDLSSSTNLEVQVEGCPKLERIVKSLPKSIRLLCISQCPISQLDFGVASFPFGLSNLKEIHLYENGVCRISFSQDCCPHLTTLSILCCHHLEEIEALPRTAESISLNNCEMLNIMPSFAGLTSLRKFVLTGCHRIEKIEGLKYCTILESLIVKGCHRIEKIEGLKYCTGLENLEVEGCHRIEKVEGLQYCTRLQSLTVDGCWEVQRIESLERMEKLRKMKLTAINGAVIERCIQTIQKWPYKIQIYARAVPDASSLVDSLLFPNLVVVDSFSNQKIQSKTELVNKPSSNGDAIMLCFIINCVSSQIELAIHSHGHGRGSSFVHAECLSKVEKGRWAWIGVFPQRSTDKGSYWLDAEGFHIGVSKGDCGEEDEVEKGLVVRGEEQTVVKAFRGFLSLLQS